MPARLLNALLPQQVAEDALSCAGKRTTAAGPAVLIALLESGMLGDVNAHISTTGRNILHRAVAEWNDPDWVEALLTSSVGLDVHARAQVSGKE